MKEINKIILELKSRKKSDGTLNKISPGAENYQPC